MSESRLFIGAMSGTSIDALDIAAVEFTESGPALLIAGSVPWPADLHSRVRRFAQGERLDAGEFALLDNHVGRFFADSINRFLSDHSLAPEHVEAIGCHGQTVAHLPSPLPGTTLQLGDGNVVAESTGITTVTDFRRRDMAAGGQGAPLAPAFHVAALRDSGEQRVVLNLGGIANITVLPSDDAAPLGYDTGPANCLMDLWTQRSTGKPFDENGAWASLGKVREDLLSRMLDDAYFALPAPKSTGTQYFSQTWLDDHLAACSDSAAVDIQATLLALTRITIAQAIRKHAPDCARVLVCGGGAHNAELMRQLAADLGKPVESTATHGIDPDWMEAMAFAWLARQTLRGEAGNLPSVTGAAGWRILGAVHFA